MRTIWASFVLTAALAAAQPASAQAARTVRVGAGAEAALSVLGRPGYMTMIEFTAAEGVVAAAVSDPTAWRAQTAPGSPLVFVRPLRPGAAATMTITTDRRRYKVKLEARPAKEETPFRVVVEGPAPPAAAQIARAIAPAAKPAAPAQPKGAKASLASQAATKPVAANPAAASPAKPKAKQAAKAKPAPAKLAVAKPKRPEPKPIPAATEVPAVVHASAPSSAEQAPPMPAATPSRAWNGAYAVRGARTARPQMVADNGVETRIWLRKASGPVQIIAIEEDGSETAIATASGPEPIVIGRVAPAWRILSGETEAVVSNVRWRLDPLKTSEMFAAERAKRG